MHQGTIFLTKIANQPKNVGNSSEKTFTLCFRRNSFIYIGNNACTICGKVFSSTQAKLYNNKYCSKKCRYMRSTLSRRTALCDQLGDGEVFFQHHLSRKKLSDALNVSSARISQLAKAGMPLDSVEAARHWRNSNKRQRGRRSTKSDEVVDSDSVPIVQMTVSDQFVPAENDMCLLQAQHTSAPALTPVVFGSDEESLSIFAERIFKRNID